MTPAGKPRAASQRERCQRKALAKSNPEIGDILRLSAGTARNYVSRIFVKIDVSDRAQADASEVRLGL